jgi:hypothetical protein
MAAIRCLTVLRALVATDIALRSDLIVAAFFFADFAFFAALRFVAIVSISSCTAR